ncbi:hypothetical protein CKA32_006576 [Geitlerinema sp. FC II]|nr:hypothetical protein CKA32_001622 [Geitlerinema sp. FC II]PPT10578.1 hypothetical protein CKA32_006576 [Geitlerinema sp. FC II]
MLQHLMLFWLFMANFQTSKHERTIAKTIGRVSPTTNLERSPKYNELTDQISTGIKAFQLP